MAESVERLPQRVSRMDEQPKPCIGLRIAIPDLAYDKDLAPIGAIYRVIGSVKTYARVVPTHQDIKSIASISHACNRTFKGIALCEPNTTAELGATVRGGTVEKFPESG